MEFSPSAETGTRVNTQDLQSVAKDRDGPGDFFKMPFIPVASVAADVMAVAVAAVADTVVSASVGSSCYIN